MRHRTLGGTGLHASIAGLGCNAFGRRIDEAQSIRVVHAALDAGITFFDTADIYSDGESERILGVALRGRRDDVLVATKFGGPMPGGGGAGRDWVLRAVEDSLRRLGTDRIDLYQLHFPVAETPLEETLGALDECVRQGKVRGIGHSNFPGWQVADADWISRTRDLAACCTAQNHWSLLEREVEADVVPACEHFGLSLLPYLPLAGGLLTGKYRRGEPPPEGSRFAGDRRFDEWLADERRFDAVGRLEAIAREAGVTIVHVALAWLAAQPVVGSVIAGATTPEQVAANVAATLWQPDEETLTRIGEAAPRRS